MVSMSSALPIIIMTRNDGLFLKQCVDSIIKTVTIDVEIYIVDNASDSISHKKIMDDLATCYENVNLVLNKKNQWILGLNKTIGKIRSLHKGEYFFLTDADIDFTKCRAKPCWLTYVKSKLDNNMAIGKLGISLSWDYLENNSELSSILDQERSMYSEDHKVQDMYVSFVDTTATLFRFDWSLEGSGCFYPDHMRYLRPELYSCRTSRDVLVEHLGWHLYNKKNIQSKVDINNKILCFTLFGGSVKDEVLNLASKRYAVFYKCFSRLILKLWILRRYYFLAKYIIIKGRSNFDGHGV